MGMYVNLRGHKHLTPGERFSHFSDVDQQICYAWLILFAVHSCWCQFYHQCSVDRSCDKWYPVCTCVNKMCRVKLVVYPACVVS